MSKRINVNPAHYKVAGRERPGDAVPELERVKAAEDLQESRHRPSRKPKPPRVKKRR